MKNDMQKFMDTINAAMRDARSDYHLTLGSAINVLKDKPKRMPIRFDASNLGPHRPHSYRGYYSDLAFAGTSDPVTAGDFLKLCEAALGKIFEGYKGGNYKMAEDTPLWFAAYGCTGPAIVGLIEVDDTLILVTKGID